MGSLASNGYAEQPKEKMTYSQEMGFVLIKPGKIGSRIQSRRR